LPTEWSEASEIRSANTRLTIEQLRELTSAVNELVDHYVATFRNQDAPGARPVHIEFDAFAVIDATAQPAGDAS
jgi:hypothetical protein